MSGSPQRMFLAAVAIGIAFGRNVPSCGTLAFVAGLLAKTGEMKITTETAVIGIRGTTGVVDVPEGGAAGEAKVKLYPDADGRVGRQSICSNAHSLPLT